MCERSHVAEDDGGRKREVFPSLGTCAVILTRIKRKEARFLSGPQDPLCVSHADYRWSVFDREAVVSLLPTA